MARATTEYKKMKFFKTEIDPKLTWDYALRKLHPESYHDSLYRIELKNLKPSETLIFCTGFPFEIVLESKKSTLILYSCGNFVSKKPHASITYDSTKDQEIIVNMSLEKELFNKIFQITQSLKKSEFEFVTPFLNIEKLKGKNINEPIHINHPNIIVRQQ